MRATRFAVVLFALLLAACGGEAETDGADTASPATEETAAEPVGPGPECVETDELTAVDNEFEPECIITSGALTVTNEGKAQHTFTISGSVDILLASGKSEEVDDVTDGAEPDGETHFLCKIHPGMDGFLWVQ